MTPEERLAANVMVDSITNQWNSTKGDAVDLMTLLNAGVACAIRMVREQGNKPRAA